MPPYAGVLKDNELQAILGLCTQRGSKCRKITSDRY